MSKVFLIAETPRAGKWNHRYLVAEGNTLSERAIAKFVSSARHELIGKNYIAVKRDVSQEQSGRTGQEILLLVGVNTECLSDNEKQKITTSLESCLTNGLDRLVTNTIEWNSIGTSMLVERSELNEWGKQFSRLPHIEIIETSSFEFTHQKISRVELTKMGKFNQLTHWFLEFSWGVKLMLLTVATIGLGLFLISDSLWCSILSCTETRNEKVSVSPKQNATNALNAWIEDADLKDAGLPVKVILDETITSESQPTQQRPDKVTRNMTLNNVLEDLSKIKENPTPLQSSDVISWNENWEKQKLTLTMRLISEGDATKIRRSLPAFTEQTSLADIVKERDFIRSFYKKLQEVKVNLEQKCNQLKLKLELPTSKFTATDYPYLMTFVCTCVLNNNCNVSEDNNKDSLIFFSQYDAKRAELLVSFYKNGMSYKLGDQLPANKKLSDDLCELANREKNPVDSLLLQKSREDGKQDANITTDKKAPWEKSLNDFSKVFEQCPKKSDPHQQDKESEKKMSP